MREDRIREEEAKAAIKRIERKLYETNFTEEQLREILQFVTRIGDRKCY